MSNDLLKEAPFKNHQIRFYLVEDTPFFCPLDIQKASGFPKDYEIGENEVWDKVEVVNITAGNQEFCEWFLFNFGRYKDATVKIVTTPLPW